MSTFGEEFLKSLDRLVSAQQAQRDKATSQKEELKQAQQQLEEELRTVIRDGEEQQKIAREVKGKDYSVNPDTSGTTETSCSSVVPDSSHGDSAEVSFRLRPWLDDQNTNQNTSKNKKGKKTQCGFGPTQKPWLDGEDQILADSEDRTGGSQGRKPGIEVSLGLRPWLDEQDGGAENEGQTAEGKPSTRLRPWLDEQYSAEESQARRKHSKKKSKDQETAPAGDDLGAHVLAPAPRDSNTQALSNQRSVPSYHGNHDNDYTNCLGSARSSRGDSDHQPAVSGSKDARQMDADRPPRSTDLVSNCPPTGPKTGRHGAKARNYEPTLYVANRTLSLRRSGSLTKLSEPSMDEYMAQRMSVSGQPKVDSSRTNSRQSSR